MQLTILGSGNAEGQKNRAAAGYLVKADNKLIMLDAGEGTKQQIFKTGHSIYDLTHFFITHTHVDHVSELPAILWPIRWSKKATNNLTLFGPPKFKQFYNKMISAYIPDINKALVKITVKELKNNKFKLGQLTIQTKIMPEKMSHSFSPYGIGYRITNKNKSLTYCGDNDELSQYDIIDLAAKSDILLIDCGCLTPCKGHLNPKLSAQIGTKAKVKELILTHFPDNISPSKVKKIAAKYFAGHIIIAKDLMKIKI